jgi:heptosyltransferase-2
MAAREETAVGNLDAAASKTGGPRERVLLVKLGAIGDVLMLLPAARRLYEHGATVDWVCGAVVGPLLGMYPWVNRIEVDERLLFQQGKAGQAKALLGVWRQLAGRRYDLCAVMQYDRRYELLTRVVRARRRLRLDRDDRERTLIDGRWHANEYARVLGLHPDAYAPGDAGENMRLVRPELVPALSGEIALPPVRGRRVALVPAGAKNVLREGALRRWPLENYVALTRQLLARGHEVVLTGSAEDGWVRDGFGALLHAQSGVSDLIGRTSLPELVAVYDACDAVVTHDTGSLHIAGISRAAVLAIFGPTNMGNFLPRRERVRGIWGGERLACRPCYDGRDFAACPRNVCMEDVSVERVIAEVEAMLGEFQTAAR